MSPAQRPLELGEAAKAGNLLTMFLTGPLMGFCLAAANTDPSIQQLVDLQSTMNSVMGEWAALLLRAFQVRRRSLDAMRLAGACCIVRRRIAGLAWLSHARLLTAAHVALAAGTPRVQVPGPKSPWSVVFRDALLRRLVLRFVLCRAALSLHTSVGRDPANLPKVFPELPKEVRRCGGAAQAGDARARALLRGVVASAGMRASTPRWRASASGRCGA